MFNPKTNYAKIAYDAILFFVSTGQVRKQDANKIPADLKLNRACIVSIYNADNNLRGLYGDVKPVHKMLYDEIIENAIGAASKDKKLKPLSSDELNNIKVYVEVLSVLHKVENINELKPHKHGLYLKGQNGKYAFVMPGQKKIKTMEQQIEKVKQIAEISETDNSKLDLFFFKSTRYD